MTIIKQIAEYASLAWLVLELVLVAVVCVSLFVKKHKADKQEQTEIEVANAVADSATEKAEVESIINKLVTVIVPAGIKVAETLGVSGKQVKKMLCLSHIMQLCVQENIDYKKYADFIDGEIEALIDFSKAVNAKGR